MSKTFRQLAFEKAEKEGREVPTKVLALDPGLTVGYCVLYRAELQTTGQAMGDWRSMARLIKKEQPTVVVFEEYRIYQHKLRVHANSDVPTLQLIGQIKMLCDMQKIPYYTQSAQVGKGFVTDERLRAWNMYFSDYKHANDACRHGCHYILFGASHRPIERRGRSKVG